MDANDKEQQNGRQESNNTGLGKIENNKHPGPNVPWTVHHDINFEAITKLMHKYLYSYNIRILYMFRVLLCSSSGG